MAADPITDDHERVHDDDLAKRLGSEPPHIELTQADAGVTFPDAVEVEPRLELGERLQVAVQRPGHFSDDPEAGMAGPAGTSGVMLDLRKHVLRLEPLRQRLLEEHQPASAHLGARVDALGRERIEDVFSAIVDHTDAKLAALETGADVRDGDRHLLVALVVQRADVVGRTELLYCRANSFEAIVGIHGVLPKGSTVSDLCEPSVNVGRHPNHISPQGAIHFDSSPARQGAINSHVRTTSTGVEGVIRNLATRASPV